MQELTMDIVSIHTFLAELIGKHGVAIDYESILETQYRSFLRADATIIDIGAHAGRHTKVFVELAPRGKVIAVEPLPDKASALRSAFGPSISLFEGALAENEGRMRFIWAQGTPEESGLRERQYNDPARAKPTEIEVEVTTLDRLTRALTRCDFIKIDVEGAELTALRGGGQLLSRLRPTISVEFGRPAYSVYGHEAVELFTFAEGQGYRIYDIFQNPVPDLETWLKVCDIATWDYFLLPKERDGDFTQATPVQTVQSQSAIQRLFQQMKQR